MPGQSLSARQHSWLTPPLPIILRAEHNYDVSPGKGEHPAPSHPTDQWIGRKHTYLMVNGRSRRQRYTGANRIEDPDLSDGTDVGARPLAA